MRHVTGVCLAALGAVAMLVNVGAVTRVPSADGQFWDIQDTSAWAQDSGGIATGGRANPFNGFGYLKLQVRLGDNTPVLRNHYLRGFGLAYDGADRFDSITPVLREGIVVARAIFAPRDTSYLRYFDTFTNTSARDRVVEVAWGGASGAYEDGGRVAVATTSNGDRRIDLADSFVTVMQNARNVADPMRGPSGHGPSAHVLGSKAAGLLTSVGDMYSDPFVDKWPGFDPAHIGYVFRLRLRPGQTSALVTFVVKGLSEVYDPRGGFPVAVKDGLIGAEPVYSGADAKIPPAGSEIARVTGIAHQLVQDPDLRGLTPRERAQIVNWNQPALEQRPPFTVFEKSVTELQEAMTRGERDSRCTTAMARRITPCCR
jgi:amidase